MPDRQSGPDFWRELPARIDTLISVIPGLIVFGIALYVISLAIW